MCVIVVKPHDKEVTEADMALCFTQNPHGAGFMYTDGQRVQVVKGLFTFKDFWDAYLEHSSGPAKDKIMVLHFRIATSGEKDVTNCHPHVLSQDFAFVHNGVMSDYAYAGKEEGKFSDTHHFGQEVLAPLLKAFGPTFLHKADLFAMIEKYIGTYNKMVFLNAKNFWIANKTQGYDIDGVWYSNKNWQPTPSYGGYTAGTDYGTYNQKWKSNWKEKAPKTEGVPETKETKGLRSCSARGCWLPHLVNPGNYRKGRFVTWPDYASMYPNYDGPYEWFLQGKANPDEEGEGNQEAQNVRIDNIKKNLEKTGENFPLLLPRIRAVTQDSVSHDIPTWPKENCVVCTGSLTRKEMDTDANVCGICDVSYGLGSVL